MATTDAGQHYLKRISRELKREIREVAPEARAARHPWPGNIRELQSTLKQALLQASGTILLTAFLPELRSQESGSQGRNCAGSSLTPDSCHLTLMQAWKHSSANGLYRMLPTYTRKRIARLDQVSSLLLRVLDSPWDQHQAARLLNRSNTAQSSFATGCPFRNG